jgi:hypothetical protein
LKRILLILIAALAVAAACLEVRHDPSASTRRFSVGSSAFVAANLVLAARPDSPDLYQMNAGYWLTNWDAVSLEAITWWANAPVGILAFETSIAATYCPIDTKLPETFQEKERNRPNYFFFEAGLHFALRL